MPCGKRRKHEKEICDCGSRNDEPVACGLRSGGWNAGMYRRSLPWWKPCRRRRAVRRRLPPKKRRPRSRRPPAEPAVPAQTEAPVQTGGAGGNGRGFGGVLFGRRRLPADMRIISRLTARRPRRSERRMKEAVAAQDLEALADLAAYPALCRFYGRKRERYLQRGICGPGSGARFHSLSWWNPWAMRM